MKTDNKAPMRALTGMTAEQINELLKAPPAIVTERELLEFIADCHDSGDSLLAQIATAQLRLETVPDEDITRVYTFEALVSVMQLRIEDIPTSTARLRALRHLRAALRTFDAFTSKSDTAFDVSTLSDCILKYTYGVTPAEAVEMAAQFEEELETSQRIGAALEAMGVNFYGVTVERAQHIATLPSA